MPPSLGGGGPAPAHPCDRGCGSPPFTLHVEEGTCEDEKVAPAGHVYIDKTMAACGDEIETSKASGVDVSTAVMEGDAASSLISEAKGAALLVVGRRGHGGLARLVRGSVSRYVATHAHCPVVVVPDKD